MPKNTKASPVLKKVPKDLTNRLIDQFYITLLASCERIHNQNGSSGSHASFDEVKALLAREPRTWRTAYHVEQLLVPHLNDQELELELRRRLVDAQRSLAPEVYGAYEQAKGIIDAQEDAAQKRAERILLLGRLTSDLQWKSELGETEREYERQITKRTAWFFIAVFVTFLFYVTLATVWLLNGTDDMTNSEIVNDYPVPFYLFSVGLAVLAGCLGACFSMLSSLKSRLQQSTLDDLKILNSPWNLSTRLLIGFCAGLLVYYFIRSWLIQGPLVPNLAPDEQTPGFDLFQALALLVVWCFLGGFSERLVPALLSKTEVQADIVGSSPSPLTSEDNAVLGSTTLAARSQGVVDGDGSTVASARAKGLSDLPARPGRDPQSPAVGSSENVEKPGSEAPAHPGVEGSRLNDSSSSGNARPT